MDKENNMNNILFGGYSDVGWQREINEDFIDAIKLSDNVLFMAVADGAGSKNGNMLQPASIAIREVTESLRMALENDEQVFRDNAELFLKQALYSANRIISAFTIANEELYSGFATTFTCYLLFDGKEVVFGHIGNAQLMLLRLNKSKDTYIPKILTKEHTKAREMYEDGIIEYVDYVSHPDRMVVTGALGIATSPEFQFGRFNLKPGDFIIMTSDGIHYAIRPEPLAQIVIDSENCDNASRALVEAAKGEKWNDNMSALILFNKLETA